MQIAHIDHVSLNLADRDRALDWYAAALGLSPASRCAAPDEPVFLGAPGARLGLFAQGDPGLRHVALAVRQAEADAVAARVRRLGGAVRLEAHRSHRSAYLTDPEGNVVELVTPVV